jgi:hypothetical protein
MTQEPARLPDFKSYPIEDDDLDSLPGCLGSRRIDRAAPPVRRVETAKSDQLATVARPGIPAPK